MEIIIALVVVIGVLYWFFIRDNKNIVSTPASEQELTPKTTAWHTAPPEGTKPVHLENPLDVNQDGKVTLDDVKEVVKKVRKPRTAKAEVAEKPAKKTAAKKAAPKKEAAKKPAAKKPTSKKV